MNALLCYLGSHYLGACLGVGALYSSSQNSYIDAYLGVGACPGHYSVCKYEILAEFNLAVTN